MMAYSLREREPKDYSELSSTRLPRAERCKDRYYPVEVVEEKDDQVKLHYVEYSDVYDEWRSTSDVVSLRPSSVRSRPRDGNRQHSVREVDFTPHNPHHDLAFRIKQALNSKRLSNEQVRIEIPFDPLVFRGGLMQLGTLTHTRGGTDIYAISCYSDLTPLLGDQWHIRGLNPRMNFCYVNLESVRFYLMERAPVDDYKPDGTCVKIKGGFMLIFKFLRMDGVQRHLQDILSIQ